MLSSFFLWFLASLLVFGVNLFIIILFLYNFNISSLNIVEYTKLYKNSLIYYEHSVNTLELLCIFLISSLLGYIIDKNFKIIDKITSYFNINQPFFYKKLSPTLQPFIPCLSVSIAVILTFGIVSILFKNLYLFIFILGVSIGLCLKSIFIIRETLILDRPEKPPKAIIHNFLPKFPLELSLFLGQIYLRILLPLFFIFILSILPLLINDDVFVLFSNNNFSPFIIILGVFLGLSLAWYIDKDNYIVLEKLDKIVILRLSIILLFSSLLINYGIFSQNVILLILCSFLAGVNLNSQIIYS